MKILRILGIVAIVVVIGFAVGWWGTRSSQNRAPGPSTLESPSVAQTAPPAQPDLFSKPTPATVTQPNATTQQEGTATNSTAPASTNLITDWEDRLDNILGADGEDSDKVKQLLEMFPRLPEDGQIEVAQHLANLTPDEDFGALGKYLTNSTMPEAVLDVLMSDLLNRPNTVKLPLLVNVASDSQNPKASEAKDLLELFLEEDYGTDWNTWSTKVTQWLKDNPD